MFRKEHLPRAGRVVAPDPAPGLGAHRVPGAGAQNTRLRMRALPFPLQYPEARRRIPEERGSGRPAVHRLRIRPRLDHAPAIPAPENRRRHGRGPACAPPENVPKKVRQRGFHSRVPESGLQTPALARPAGGDRCRSPLSRMARRTRTARHPQHSRRCDVPVPLHAEPRIPINTQSERRHAREPE